MRNPDDRGRSRRGAWVFMTVLSVAQCAPLPPPDAAVPPIVLHLEPDRPWRDTGVPVRKDERLYIVADNEVYWEARRVRAGADGIQGRPRFVEAGGLMGRVSSAAEKTFLIGARTKPFPNANPRSKATEPPPPITMPADGTLWLGFKQFMPGANTGGFDITIRRVH